MSFILLSINIVGAHFKRSVYILSVRITVSRKIFFMYFSFAFAHKALIRLMCAVGYVMKNLLQVVSSWLSVLWIFYVVFFDGSHHPRRFINFPPILASKEALSSSMLSKCIVHSWNRNTKILRGGFIHIRSLGLTNSISTVFK